MMGKQVMIERQLRKSMRFDSLLVFLLISLFIYDWLIRSNDIEVEISGREWLIIECIMPPFFL